MFIFCKGQRDASALCMPENQFQPVEISESELKWLHTYQYELSRGDLLRSRKGLYVNGSFKLAKFPLGSKCPTPAENIALKL